MTKTNHVGIAAAMLAAAMLAAMLLALAAMKPAEAAFAGKNGKITFYHDGDVWTMNPNGSAKTRLTNDYNAEGNPSVSPDGTKIAYEFVRGIWTMNADGSGKKQLTNGIATDEDPTWSADGKKIAFSRNGDIWAMNSNGSGLTNLTKTPNNEERDPAWSPLGNKIAYTRGSCGAGTCVYVMNTNGSGQTNLTPEDSLPQCPNQPGYYHNGSAREPSWSPNGSRIAFSGALICPHTLGKDIWVMNADGSGKKNLINDQGTNDEKPVFSPDGTKIVFQSNRDGNGSPLELYTMSANGSGIQRLTNNSVWDSDADWAPLDTTAPTVNSVSPASGAKGVSPKANVTATFSEAMQANTLNKNTVKLVEKGATKPVTAAVTYDADARKVTLNPASNLDSGATYTATITTGATDAAGNALSSNKAWSFKVE